MTIIYRQTNKRIMKKRVIFFLFLLIPVSLLVWFAYRAQINEQLASQQQYQNLAHSQLKLIDEKIVAYFQQLEVTLNAQRQQFEQNFFSKKTDFKNNGFELNINNIRSVLKQSPYILNLYISDAEHKGLYPTLQQTLSEKEQAFLNNIKIISENASLFNHEKEMDNDRRIESSSAKGLKEFFTLRQNLSPISQTGQFEADALEAQGWISWYRDRNLHPLFWFKDSQNRLYILYLDRVRILSEIIALLPETIMDENNYNQFMNDTTIRLNNSNNELIYEWGDYSTTENQISIDRMLSYPLSSWKLSWYAKSLSEESFQKKWSLVIIALLASLLIVALMIVFYREYNREIRLAQQRVNFVSQVSHELKTPLTNIRMYAELLESKIANFDMLESSDTKQQTKSQHFLSVIVNESQRLSRLIENVLSFAKVQKDSFKINKTKGVIDDCIKNVLLSFEPVFTQKHLKVNFNGNAQEDVYFDMQLLEQILNNLLSNIEKYAAQGKQIDISSTQKQEQVLIEVRDYGPGIPRTEQNKIFKPFYRSHSEITEGVSGTGIGLTISQQLAGLHGGQLLYKAVSPGACFVIQLNTQEKS